VLKPNVNCVTLAAGYSTPQVYNVNWVVPPAWYISQNWWGHVPPSSYGGAALVNMNRHIDADVRARLYTNTKIKYTPAYILQSKQVSQQITINTMY